MVSTKTLNVLALQLPSPPRMNVIRNMAGGFGLASSTTRPDFGHDDHSHVVPDLFVISCAAILNNHGYKTCFVDTQTERLNIPKILKIIGEVKPNVIVTGINLPSVNGDLEILSHIKKKYNEIAIIDVGKVARRIPDFILKEKTVDILLTGDSEITIVDCVNCIESNKGLKGIPGIVFMENETLFSNPQIPYLTDLDGLPSFPVDLFPDYRYTSPLLGKENKCGYILTSKGCPFPCKYYCPYPSGFGEKVRFRDPNKVVDEIQLLQDKYGIDRIFFRDQTFTIDYKHAQQVCQEIIDRKITIFWCCETRLDRVDKYILELMRESGCEQISYGLESADPELFAKIGKPGKKLEELDGVVSMTKDAGIRAHTHLIVGLPGDNWKSIKKTAKRLKKWNPDSIYINLATPYPGTKFYEDAVKNNWLQTNDLSFFSSANPIVRTEQMSLKDLVKAREYLSNQIRGYTLYKRIKKRVFNLLGQ